MNRFMKSMVFGSVLALGVSGAALAEEPAKNPQPAEQPAKPVPAKPMKMKKVATPSKEAAKPAKEPAKDAKKAEAKAAEVQGSVVSVDAAQHTVTIKDDSGEKTLSVSPTAKIMRAGKKISLKDVQSGEKLSGKLHKKGGKEVLDQVTITAAA